MSAPEFKAPPTIGSAAMLGDCATLLQGYPDQCVDLIVTSPPYADQRASTYGGIRPDDYVAWFLPRSEQFLRVLKPTGSFVLNIKEKAVNGERHTYVLELILALRKQGWLWTEEYIWHKKNCFPGKWPNRFRDAWERCLHFTRQRQFKMNQQAVMVPTGDWAQTRLKSLGKNDVVRYDSQVGNAFAKNIANWQGREMAYPTNVLHLATECGNKQHSAAFPLALPQWFIKLFTDEGDVVLDPFAGSGTTLQAAVELKRHAIGIDVAQEYVDMCREILAPVQGRTMEPRTPYVTQRSRKTVRPESDRCGLSQQAPGES
ncbi:site-specific DNA-methyltransferase [Ramlibacter sp. H39-3-26]|uniref:DNA-methyltransferase n=1 Tax=Curvibacter soli TaxID=3031331 RepID=UPI0023DC42FF|nr:site-specific DNA-methyltransferase [Ramlibacter sp. H39-3-26]MDF1486095.1 site-specific DNA-methyltransferase [Ramlibacter sp. H39-3-26]